MQLSPLFLERLEAAEQRGKLQGNKDLVLRQLVKQMGAAVPIELVDSSACAKGDRIRALSVEQVEALGEVLLDFHGVQDLVTWLGEG